MHDVSGLQAGIYLRISADREGTELGIQRQLTDCTRLAERCGLSVHKVYSDNDTSATTTSSKPRPEFKKLLRDARAGKIQVILAYTTSRLTRRPREHEDLLDLATQHRVRFFFVASPSFDLNTAAGREVARHMAARDTAEAEDIQERTQRKKLQDAIDGKINGGGRRCYGYGLPLGINPATGREVRDLYKMVPEEVEVLLEGKERTLSGESTRSIVKDFRRRNLLTAMGLHWTVGGYRRTLLNPSYIIFDPDDPQKRGTRLHRGSRHQAQYPGTFTQTEHDMLTEMFAGNSSQYAPPQGRSYLVTGITSCGLCGGRMYGMGKKEGGKYIRRYACKKWNGRGEQIGCGKIFRVAEPLEQLIKEAVLYRFDSPEVAAALVPTGDRERAKQLARELTGLQKRRRDLATKHALEPYDEEDYAIMLGAIKTRTAEVEAELLRLRTAEAKHALMPDISCLREKFETASLEWMLSVIKLVVKEIVVHRDDGPRVFWKGRQFNPDKIEIRWSV